MKNNLRIVNFWKHLAHSVGKVCGTQNGLLKLIDLESGKEVSTTRRNNNYVSDVCVKVTYFIWQISLTWPGRYRGCCWLVWRAFKVALHGKRLEQQARWAGGWLGGGLFFYSIIVHSIPHLYWAEQFLQVPRLLVGREVERLLDFTDKHLVTTFRLDDPHFLGTM